MERRLSFLVAMTHLWCCTISHIMCTLPSGQPIKPFWPFLLNTVIVKAPFKDMTLDIWKLGQIPSVTSSKQPKPSIAPLLVSILWQGLQALPYFIPNLLWMLHLHCSPLHCIHRLTKIDCCQWWIQVQRNHHEGVQGTQYLVLACVQRKPQNCVGWTVPLLP